MPLLCRPGPQAFSRGSLGWDIPPARGLLSPDLCPSWNRETSAHQTPSVRAQGASPHLPQPLSPGQEGGSACYRPRGGAAYHQAAPGARAVTLPTGSQPSLTSSSPGPPSPSSWSLPGSSAPVAPHLWVLSHPPGTCPQCPALRGARQGSPAGPSPLWVGPWWSMHPQPSPGTPAWGRGCQPGLPGRYLSSAIKVCLSVCWVV